MQVKAMVLKPNIGNIEISNEITKLRANCFGVKPCFSKVLNLFQRFSNLSSIIKTSKFD